MIRTQCAEDICCDEGKLFCKRCHLYCSRACQEDDWKRHKAECKKSVIKHEKLYADYLFLEPAVKGIYGSCNTYDEVIFLMNMDNLPVHQYNERVFKVLWGMTPPRDILNLAKNEGMNYQKDLDLCFTTAVDLRSVMATINGLPSNYRGHCNVVVNETDELSTFRNMLILVLAHENHGGMFTDAIIHLWYSASVTLACYAQISRASFRIKELFGPLLVAYPVVQRATLPYGYEGTKSMMWLSMNFEQIKMFGDLFAVDRSMERFETNRRFSMGGDCDPVLNRIKDMWLAHIPPVHRVVEQQYRDTGILRPYGASVTGFVKPNRTFYNTDGDCILGYLPRPTDSVDLFELARFSKTHGLPNNDINGALYHYTASIVNKFCDRLKTHKLVFFVKCAYSSAVPKSMKGNNPRTNDPPTDWAFDRIELGPNMVDGVPTTEYISSFKPMLKTSAENPHATISLLVPTEQFCSEYIFARRAVQDMLPWRGICFKAHMTERKLMQERIRKEQEMMDKADLNWDNIMESKGYSKDAGLKDLEGLVMKWGKGNDVWPWQLQDHFTLEDFVLRFSGGVKGTERLVEWKRAYGSG